MAEYSVPALPYSFDALEPHIDAKTMEIHHDKHHAAYIKNLNDAITANDFLKGKTDKAIVGDLAAIKDEALRTTLRNNGGGHWNHSFFWEILAPAAKSGEPGDDLAAAIKSAFGSLDGLKKSFNEAATKRFGSGWAWLIHDGSGLAVVGTPNQDNPISEGKTPLLGVDVWEHAYYLKYQNKRPDYLDAWWNTVNWAKVAEGYSAVS